MKEKHRSHPFQIQLFPVLQKRSSKGEYVRYNVIFFLSLLSNGFIHFWVLTGDLTTLMHVSIWRKSFVLLLGIIKHENLQSLTPLWSLASQEKGLIFWPHLYIHLFIWASAVGFSLENMWVFGHWHITTYHLRCKIVSIFSRPSTGFLYLNIYHFYT